MTNFENVNLENEKVRQYLFAEMNLENSESFEEKMFLDDDFFHEVVDLENDLIDRYAAGKMPKAEVLRFEKSLEKFPDRRGKIANAIALQSFIAEEKKVSETEIVPIQQPTFWEKLQAFFTMPALTFGMSGILVLLTIFSVFLLLDNQRKAEELAVLQQNDGNENIQQQVEKDLREKLNQSNQTENQLQTRIDEQREATGELTEELERERILRKKLRRSLEELKRGQNTENPPETIETPEIAKPPRVASIKLTPANNLPNQMNVGKTSVGENTSLLAVNLSLPAETKKGERFSVKLNDKPFLENVAWQTSSDGKKIISLTVQTKNLVGGKNKLSVVDAGGGEVTAYVFDVEKR